MLKDLFKTKVKSDMPSKTVVLDGHSIVLYGAPGDTYFTSIASTPDRDITNHFDTLNGCLRGLPVDAVVLDVGANIGLTVAAASMRLTRGKVYGVEPSPKAFKALAEMTSINALANVTIINKCLGETPGMVPFIEADFLAGSYVGADTREAPTVDVEMTTVDILVKELRLDRLDLVKIDVEGFELDILKGATETIERFNPRFVVEFNSFAIACNRNQSPQQLADFIIDTFGKFEVKRHGIFYPVMNTKTIRDFIFANMASFGCVEDVVFGGFPR